MRERPEAGAGDQFGGERSARPDQGGQVVAD